MRNEKSWEATFQHLEAFGHTCVPFRISLSLSPFALSLCPSVSCFPPYFFFHRRNFEIWSSDCLSKCNSAHKFTHTQTHTHTHTHFNINNCHLQSQPHENHITGHLESKQSDTSKTNLCIKPSLTHYKWTVSNAGDLFMPNQHKSGFSTMIRSSRPSTAFTEVTLCLSADIKMYLHLTLLGFSQALRKTEHTKDTL